MSAKNRHAKAAQNGVLTYLKFYSCYDLVVTILKAQKTQSRLNRFKDCSIGMNRKTLAKANKEEIVRMSGLLWVIKKFRHITAK